MVKLTLDIKEPEPLSPRLARIRLKTLNYVTIELMGNLKRFSPVDHGRLQGSWTIFNRQEDSRTIKSSANYAEYVNRGTGLYGPYKKKIYPKNAKLLGPFKYNGKMIAVPWTRGMKPRKYVEKSIETTEKRIDEFLIRSAIEVDLDNM